MKILYLDFGNDRYQTEKEVAFLNKKYATQKSHLFGNTETSVVVINLQDAILNYSKEGNFNEFISYLKNVKNINEYDEIIIGVHGIKGDVHVCYLKPSIDQPMQPLCKTEELADLTAKIFEHFNLKKKAKIVLMICYAGRTENHHEDHISKPISAPLNSFAYRFYMRLCKEFDISMIAGTGATRIGDDGEFEVETEEGIKFNDKKNECSKAYQEIKQKFELARKQFIDKHGVKEWNQYEECGFKSDNIVLDNLCWKYNNIKNELLELIGSGPEPEKNYGVIAYDYSRESNSCTITLKHKGEEIVLYHDNLKENEAEITSYSVKNSRSSCIIQ